MTDNPITPPPELVRQRLNKPQVGGDFAQEFAAFFARWGADQELEACCEWLQARISEGWNPCHLEDLRAARRPKSPSLKEQALMALEDGDIGPGASLTPVEVCIIRRALEQLND